MSLPAIEEKLRGQSDRFRKFSWPILIVSAALTVGLVADLAFVDTPSFHTDLSDFAPGQNLQMPAMTELTSISAMRPGHFSFT